MPNYVPCLLLTRVVLPLCLTFSIIRPNLLSFIYLLLFFYTPWANVPTSRSMRGSTGRYLKLVMICSILTSIAQLSFQAVLLYAQPYGEFLEIWDGLERILRHIGLIRLDKFSFDEYVLTLGPEALMLVSSIAIYILSSKLAFTNRSSITISQSAYSKNAIELELTSTRRRHYTFLVAWGKYVVLLSLCVAGVMRPSVLSGVYFLTFLGGMTWWACYKDLHKVFSQVCYCVPVVVALHVIALFVIQLRWVQNIVITDWKYCRYLGMTPLFVYNNIDPRRVTFVEAEWATYFNPISLLWLYFILVLEGRFLLKSSIQENKILNLDGKPIPLSYRLNAPLFRKRPSYTRQLSDSQKVHLIRGVSTSSKHSSTTSKLGSTAQHSDVAGGSVTGNMYQDTLGNVVITDGVEDFHLRRIRDEEESQTSMFEQIVNCISTIVQTANRSSYIATIIIMMVWSITFHSWLAFVLLLWASVMWMIPNQQRAMLRCSPFLIFYAECLLLIQYLYSMDLTEDELPQEVQGLNLRQIGFVKPTKLPCKLLLAKCLYTIMFWITFRQFMQERYEQLDASTQGNTTPPILIYVSTATKGITQQSYPQTCPVLTRIGDIVKRILIKYWIWVAAIMLFVIGISGSRITIFRIVYMALFLLFVLVFQISYKLWRRIMYGFWLMVIFYSMSILVLFYIYQFDNFPKYMASVGISSTLQMDFGLERFKTGELFIRLLTPSFFLVITVIQLHYFHKDFLAGSDICTRLPASRKYRSEERLAAAKEMDEKNVRDQQSNIPKRVHMRSIHDIKNLSITDLKHVGKKIFSKTMELIELVWLFLELHMLKIMFLSIILLTLYDVCVLHFILLLLVVGGIPFGRKSNLIITHICSLLVSGLLLSKMIYQIKYIKHDVYNVNCVDMVQSFLNQGKEKSNFTINSVEWFGLRKVELHQSLPDLLKGYIGIILTATLLAVINIRQKYMRDMRGLSANRPYFMFPNIKRKDADHDLVSCIKFFCNHGFYKFGVEICMIMTVVLISVRMDLYAALYSFWICIMFCLSRNTLSKVWSFYQGFIVIIIPLQYALAVGPPPGLCIKYPWYSSPIMRRMQDWMLLPDPVHRPPAYKLICDFILLLLVCRQAVVFQIHKKVGDNYPGGTNKDLEPNDIEKPTFVNPVPDHIVHIRSWLDVLKRGVLSGFMWLTLATVFLAGTNRVSVFSVGYLIGTFIFLWQGEDLHLRPVNIILRWWNYLLFYNIAVITIKTLLQIVGCIFIEEAKEHACWAVQLFGIACIKKFGDNVQKAGISDTVECNVSRTDIGLAWDAVCFSFLIATRRLFKSHYFIHIVNETKAMTILASRGAELMEELRQKQIREQQNQEFHTLEKIKKKMEWIKAVQKKIQGPVFKELSNHDAAVRSGDYYMFEELDDDDELLELESVHEVSEYSKSKIDKKGQTKLTLGKLLTSAIKTDIEQAADLALSRAQATTQFVHKEKKEKLPLSPKKSTPFSAQSQITGTSGPPDSKSSFVKSDLITSAIKTDIEQAVDIALNKAHPTTLLVPKEEEEKLPLSQKSTLFSAQTQIPGTSGPPDSKSSFVKSDAPLTQIPGLKEKDEDEKAHEKESTSSIKDADIIQEKISHSSKGKPLSIDEDLQVEEKTKEKGSSCWHRVSAYIKFAWVFVESSMESITQYLNLLSKDYRFILKVLAMEKKTLKESYNFGEGLRTGTSMIWQPLPSVASKIGSPRSTQVSSIGMSKQGSKLEVDSALSAADEDEDQFSTHNQAEFAFIHLPLTVLLHTMGQRTNF